MKKNKKMTEELFISKWVEDCYDVISLENGEYMGTVKVPHNSNDDVKIEHFKNINPGLFIKPLEFNIDYIFVFQGLFMPVFDCDSSVDMKKKKLMEADLAAIHETKKNNYAMVG